MEDNIFKVMGVGIPSHQMEKIEEHMGTSMLQEQMSKYSALLKQLSDEMGIFEDAEQRARASKLAVAGKFAAVERLVNQTQTAIDVLSGNISNQPIPTTAKVQVAYKEGKRNYTRRGPRDIQQALQDLGGTARSGEIIEKMVSNMGCTYSAARNVFYAFKGAALQSCGGVSHDTPASVYKLKETSYAHN